MRRARFLAWLAVLLPCCATVGSPGQGDVDLPSAGVGPFRKLGQTEVPGVDPFVLESAVAHYREPAALPLGTDPSAPRVALYAVASVDGHDAIVRTRADDARAFFGTSADVPSHKPAVVVNGTPSATPSDVGGPSPLQVGAFVYLYFAAADAIYVTRSEDGLRFTDVASALLPDASVAWEAGKTPRAPTVAVLPDGRFRMLYEANGQIGEAASDDGKTFTRVDGDPSTPAMDPVLGPSSAPDAIPDGGKPPFDTFAVGDPLLLPRVTPAGRLQIRVLYTGLDGPPGAPATNSTIGFAARYGDAGPLTRQAQPVYSVNKHEAAPALFAWSGGAMLYVQQDDTSTGGTATVVPGIAGAFAPANLTLPPPADFPDSP